MSFDNVIFAAKFQNETDMHTKTSLFQYFKPSETVYEYNI
jgi:hypothetical protein